MVVLARALAQQEVVEVPQDRPKQSDREELKRLHFHNEVD